MPSSDNSRHGAARVVKRNLHILLLTFIWLSFAACKEDGSVIPIKNTGLLVRNFNFDDEATITNAFKFYSSTGAEADLYVIQNVDSLPVGTDVTRLKAQFTTSPDGVQVKVNGVLQVSGMTENDFTNPVIYRANLENGEVQSIKVVVNVAKREHNPARFILMNGELSEFDFARIADAFGRQKNKNVAVGVGVIISYLQAHPDQVLAKLNNYLQLSELYELPMVVQLDGEQWWDYRSDLWNWWDPAQAGYDPANKDNVEWFGWTSDAAVKIGWRNWGRQLRVKPMPNLMSPAYRDACHVEMNRMVEAVKLWWNNLPDEKKYLFVGIKLGWESAIGVNNWYYPNGNDYLAQPEASDPSHGLTTSMLPSRGVQTIGYAAVKTAGLGKSGTLTDTMQAEVVRIHLEDLSRIANEAGIPRDRIFTHSGGWKEGEVLYTSAINEYSCPGWSFYDHAEDPTQDTGVMTSLEKSTAPYWAAAEWLLQGNKTKIEWMTALQHTLGEQTRYVCIYNWNGIETNRNAVDAILEMNR
jgi:hypothetical protein